MVGTRIVAVLVAVGATVGSPIERRQSGGGSCTTNGEWACSTDGTQILECAYVSSTSLSFAVIETCSSGTVCTTTGSVGCVAGSVIPPKSTTTTSTTTKTTTTIAKTTSTTTTSTSTTAEGGSSCWAAWVSTANYPSGSQVSYNGINWQNKWWENPGAAPGASNGDGGWVSQGSCSGGSHTSTTTSAPIQKTTTTTTTTKTTTTSSSGNTGGNSGSKNLVGYWGQDTVYYDTGNLQTSLLSYCQSNNWNIIHLAFLSAFTGGSNNYQLNFANFGDYDTTAITSTSSASMLDIGSDITACQKLGVKIFLSLGGATGGYSVPAGTGASFATLLYNSFFSGSSSLPRPFGTAVLDGIDWDIEANIGSQADIVTTNQKLKSLQPSILISAVPQCPFPDAYIGEAVGNSAAEFDFVSVQFYNNYCEMTTSSFNYDQWATGISFPIAVAMPGSPKSANNGLATSALIQTTMDGIASGPNAGKLFGMALWDVSSSSAYKEAGASQPLVVAIRSIVNGL
ncbi:Chitinase 1 [Physocladia obscura]|uniref:Chitinase 1 n=1 Tax=Physocladia obscura TaxID=109957 RepID=A0AAD5T4Q4_9FUNG|nr:Chitinase 1 [Physocladia obscura]